MLDETKENLSVRSFILLTGTSCHLRWLSINLHVTLFFFVFLKKNTTCEVVAFEQIQAVLKRVTTFFFKNINCIYYEVIKMALIIS